MNTTLSSHKNQGYIRPRNLLNRCLCSAHVDVKGQLREVCLCAHGRTLCEPRGSFGTDPTEEKAAG